MIVSDVLPTISTRDKKGVVDVLELFGLTRVVHNFTPKTHEVDPCGVLYLSPMSLKHLSADREIIRLIRHDGVVLFDRKSIRFLYRQMKHRGYL